METKTYGNPHLNGSAFNILVQDVSGQLPTSSKEMAYIIKAVINGSIKKFLGID
jgi:hypothetical protein